MHRNHGRAFTLIELLVVISIIALLRVDKTVRPDFAMRFPYQWSHRFGHIQPDRQSELLIETQLSNYYQIAINPRGRIVDLGRAGGQLDTLWTSNIEVATHIGDGYWNIEMRVPVVDAGQFEVDPRNGLAGARPNQTYPWYFNVCRQRIRSNGNSVSAFSPTGKESFHVVGRFAQLLVK